MPFRARLIPAVFLRADGVSYSFDMEVLSHGRGFLVPEKGPGSSPGSGDTATVIVSLVEPKVGGEPGRKKSGSKVESTSNQTDFGPAAPSDSGWLGGRDDVVQQVEELLRSGEFPLLVLCGGPGHGKSTVARAVASRLVAGSFWCNTGSSCICNLRMLQDPVEVSGHIGVAIGAITNAQRRRSGFSVAELTAYLSRHHRREDERLGVVLDDADYLTLGEAKRIEFHQVLKRIIDSSDSVQLLLTSQQPIRVPGEEVPCVLVPHLSNDSARAVLARLAPGIKADQAAELASMAGGIPGTLYAVSCAIGAGMPADELIKQARQQGNLHSVRQEAYGGGGHLASLVDACSYSMGTLVREYRDALVLLGIFPSMFDVEGAAAILGASRKVMVTGLLKVLTQAHMVLPAGKGYYYVHPLVRDVLSSEVAEFEAQGRYEEARCRFVQHFGELFRRVGQEYRNCARNSGAHLEFQKHRGSIDVMMSWVGTSKQPANSEALYCKLLWTSWDLLQLLMGLPELETLTRQCVAMSQDMNDQYAEARALVMDSWVLVHQGRYQVALEELARAKEILEATCAPGHEDLATEMLVRGMALSSRGSFAEAREVLELALEVRKAAFGEDHPETAEVKCYLASILTDLAEYEYANRLHEAALAVRTDALGTDHPAVALSRLRLGQLQALCGQWIEAEKNFRRTIDICQGLSGSESELVAASLAGLAQFRFAEGFADEARMLAKRSKEVYEKALGNRHPQIAEPLLVLSHLGLSQGNVQEVEESIMQSVEVTHQHLRSDHPRVLAALNALGSFKRCKGDLEDAAILHSSVHKHVVNSLGTEHPLMATTCCHMASVREAQGNHKHALALLHQARKILEAVHGNDKHPAMVAIWGGISSVKMAQGDRDAAGHYYTKILEMSGSEEKPGCAGFFAPVAYNNLAVMMKAKGDLKQAEALYRRSLALTERSYGQGHIRRGLDTFPFKPVATSDCG